MSNKAGSKSNQRDEQFTSASINAPEAKRFLSGSPQVYKSDNMLEGLGSKEVKQREDNFAVYGTQMHLTNKNTTNNPKINVIGPKGKSRGDDSFRDNSGSHSTLSHKKSDCFDKSSNLEFKTNNITKACNTTTTAKIPSDANSTPEKAIDPHSKSEIVSNPNLKPEETRYSQLKAEEATETILMSKRPSDANSTPKKAIDPHSKSEIASDPNLTPEKTVDPQSKSEKASETTTSKIPSDANATPKKAIDPHSKQEIASDPNLNQRETGDPQSKSEIASDPNLKPEKTVDPQSKSEKASETTTTSKIPSDANSTPKKAIDPHSKPEIASDPNMILAETGDPQSKSQSKASEIPLTSKIHSDANSTTKTAIDSHSNLKKASDSHSHPEEDSSVPSILFNNADTASKSKEAINELFTSKITEDKPSKGDKTRDEPTKPIANITEARSPQQSVSYTDDGLKAETLISKEHSESKQPIYLAVKKLMDTYRTAFSESEVEPPHALVSLKKRANEEEGWLTILEALVHTIPSNDPLGPAVIRLLIEQCPLPLMSAVAAVPERILPLSDLSKHEQKRRNACLVLSCLAEKLSGIACSSLCSNHSLSFLNDRLDPAENSKVQTAAIIALENLYCIRQNRLKILEHGVMEKLSQITASSSSKGLETAESVFCSSWAIENVFSTQEEYIRKPDSCSEYNIQVRLDDSEMTEKLKLHSLGLEARNDASSFESIKSTFYLDGGCWYYEVLLVTAGVMQIGWATSKSRFSSLVHLYLMPHINYWLPVMQGVYTQIGGKTHYHCLQNLLCNHEVYGEENLRKEGNGVGDDEFSIGFDGCLGNLWYNGIKKAVSMQPWNIGDTVGCFIDVEKQDFVFYLNGKKIVETRKVLNKANAKGGFYAAASLSSFQQCRFNFGARPFSFRPTAVEFRNMDKYGFLPPEKKYVIPRKKKREQILQTSLSETSGQVCVICFDNEADQTLSCDHRFCIVCIRNSNMNNCPICRQSISLL